jgi:hypothetical protein
MFKQKFVWVKVGESTYKICFHPFFFDFPYILVWDTDLIIFFLI